MRLLLNTIKQIKPLSRKYYSSKGNNNSNSILKKSFIIGAGIGLGYSLFKTQMIKNEGVAKDFKTEKASGINYDSELYVLNKKYQLMGMGVRTVTILKFQAYSVAVYIEERGLKEFLKKNKEFKDFDKEKFLLDKEYCNQFIKQLIDSKALFAVNIIPVRATNGPHLKGGLTRNLKYHLEKQTSGPIEEKEKQVYLDQLNEFSHYFPKGVIPMNASYLFVKNSEGIDVIVDNNHKGNIQGTWLPNTLLLAYLTNSKVVSEQLRESFAELFQEYCQSK
ncbi:hypothetical protein K502DRAFT_365860 [Neoconidiobolus thromboides FSU 785]|nr:hypothetical protein K502DRAFT_365860 [Neoconidiobolus thromboides FSU 785]